ncbi:MAG: hypothetical protein LUQ54_02740 [Methanoregula sp.]|nr:hypothetical protein [Methanoregula sp.]
MNNPGKISRCGIPACGAVQGVITNSFLPWRESDADLRFGIMNFTIDFPVIGSGKKRTMRQYSAIRIYPIVNTDNISKVQKCETPSIAAFPVFKFQRNMLQNILAVGMNPRDDIFDNSPLPPSPLLATFTTLLAVLAGHHESFTG